MGGSARSQVRVALGPAVAGVLQEYWRTRQSLLGQSLYFLYFAQVFLVGWLVRASHSVDALAYGAYGAALLTFWSLALFNVGWSLRDAIVSGTYELGMASGASMFVTQFARMLVTLLGAVVGAVLSFLTVVLVASRWPPIAKPLPFLVCAVVAMAAVACVIFVVAPFAALAGARGGFLSGFISLGVVLSGFLHPLTALPVGFAIAGAAFPTSWATRALVGSAVGNLPSATTAWYCLLALAESAGWLALTALLFRVVERRLCATGRLQTG